MKLRAPGGRPWTLIEIVQGKPLGHPTHALLVHYPVAFALAVPAFDVLARTVDPALSDAATYLAVAATLIGVVAIAPVHRAGLPTIDFRQSAPENPTHQVGFQQGGERVAPSAA